MRLPRTQPRPLLVRWRRFLLPAAAFAVTAAVAAVTVARIRRRRADLDGGGVPDVIRGDRPWQRSAPAPAAPPRRALGPGPSAVLAERFPGFEGFSPFPLFAPFPDAEVVQAPDDRDTAGGGRPVPADQAALELRQENRFETAVFVRSVLILVVIALLLTARTIWIG